MASGKTLEVKPDGRQGSGAQAKTMEKMRETEDYCKAGDTPNAEIATQLSPFVNSQPEGFAKGLGLVLRQQAWCMKR
jgi:hypothetical protein